MTQVVPAPALRSQNSHDSSVNAAKRAITERLRSDQGPFDRLPSLDQIAHEIRAKSDDFSKDPRTGNSRPAMTDRALAVIERARRGERIVSMDATDEEILRRVWARADHPKNAARRDLLRQAAFDALVDSWEQGLSGGAIQCVDGRISRMLGSLTLLDFDRRNSEMRMLQTYKNAIFARTGALIDKAYADIARSDDPALRKIAEHFDADSLAQLEAIGEPDPAVKKRFLEALESQIEAMIDAYVSDLDASVRGAVPPRTIEGIKKEALKALDY